MEIYKQFASKGALRCFIYGILALALIIFFISAQTAPRQPEANAIEQIPLTITMTSGDLPAYVPATTTTVGDALFVLGITTENALVSPSLEVKLVPNLAISVLDVREVILRDGGRKSVTLLSAAPTVGEALMAAGISLGELDVIAPEPETALVKSMKIEITRISISERTETVRIPYDTTYVDAPDTTWAKELLLSAGVAGLAEESVRLRSVNGEVVSRVVTSREVLRPPTAEERQRGSKIEIDFVYEGGASWYAYKNCDCAASTKYPRGTWLRTTNLLNGKRVIVKTNDWGPDPAVHPDRIIDLDAVAFKQLAPLWKGVIPVRVEHIVTEE